MTKKLKIGLIVGGVIIALGAASAGVVLGVPGLLDGDQTEDKTPSQKEILKEKIESFLSLELEAEDSAKDSLNKQKAKLEDDNVSIEEIKKEVALQIKAILNKYLTIVNQRIKDAKDEEIRNSLTTKKTELEKLTGNANVGMDFLEGTTKPETIEETSSTKLEKDTSVYRGSLSEIKASLVWLVTTMASMVDGPSISTEIQRVKDSLDQGSKDMTQVITETQELLKGFFTDRIAVLKKIVTDVAADGDRNTFADVKEAFTKLGENVGAAGKLGVLLAAVSTVEAFGKLLTNIVELRAKFDGVAGILVDAGVVLLQRFIATKALVLKKITFLANLIPGIDGNGFAAKFFNTIDGFADFLLDIKAKLGLITGTSIAKFDDAAAAANEAANNIYEKLMNYKSISLSLEKLKTKIRELGETTSAKYQEYKELQDYFLDKDQILIDLSAATTITSKFVPKVASLAKATVVAVVTDLAKDLKAKATSFLEIGFEVDETIKAEINKLKEQLDEAGANAEEIKTQLATQIKAYLTNQKNSLDTKIKEIEDNSVEVFDEVATKLAELKQKQASLTNLLATNVGTAFLEGTTTLETLRENVFTNLARAVATYKSELDQYKASLLSLKAKFETIAPTVGTKIQEVHDKIGSKTIKISEVIAQTKDLLTAELQAKQTALQTKLTSFADAATTTYTDVKDAYDKTKLNKEKLDNLLTYITSNTEELLKDTSNLNTRFTDFGETIKVFGEELLAKFNSKKDEVSAKVEKLKSLIGRMDTPSETFRKVLEKIPGFDTILTNLKERLARLTATSPKFEEVSNEADESENAIFNAVSKYEGLSSKVEELSTKITNLGETTSRKYQNYKEIYDYFTDKTAILEDLNTFFGVGRFTAKFVKLVAYTVGETTPVTPTTSAASLKTKVETFLSLDLEEEPLVNRALNDLKAQLDSPTANVETIKANIASQIKSYLENQLRIVTGTIADIEGKGVEVFDDVATKLAELKDKLTKLQALVANANIGKEFLEETGTAVLDSLKATVFTNLAKATATYVSELAQYKTSLLSLKTKFEGVSTTFQTSIQALHDSLEAKTIKISEVIEQTKDLLVTSLGERQAALDEKLDSIEETAANKYTDVKDAYAKTKANKEKLVELLAYVKTSTEELLKNTGDSLNTRFTDFAATAKVFGEELLEKFLADDAKIAKRVAALTAFATAIAAGGFALKYFEGRDGFEAFRTSLNEKIEALKATNLTFESVLNSVIESENTVYENIKKYRKINEWIQKLNTKLQGIDNTNDNFVKFKETADYFANKAQILEDLSKFTRLGFFAAKLTDLILYSRDEATASTGITQAEAEAAADYYVGTNAPDRAPTKPERFAHWGVTKLFCIEGTTDADLDKWFGGFSNTLLGWTKVGSSITVTLPQTHERNTPDIDLICTSISTTRSS